MSSAEEIAAADLADLSVVQYPDPRLREVCTPLEVVDEAVGALAERMFEVMFAGRGVGLAAPQVGVAVRLLVASPSFDEGDRIVLVNPHIVAEDGWEEMEEGCLSFPQIFCKIKRRKIITIEALDLAGRPIREDLEGFAARVVQHEMDHLDGRLLIDRMGQLAKLAHRQALKQLEAEFAGG